MEYELDELNNLNNLTNLIFYNVEELKNYIILDENEINDEDEDDLIYYEEVINDSDEVNEIKDVNDLKCFENFEDMNVVANCCKEVVRNILKEYCEYCGEIQFYENDFFVVKQFYALKPKYKEIYIPMYNIFIEKFKNETFGFYERHIWFHDSLEYLEIILKINKLEKLDVLIYQK